MLMFVGPFQEKQGRVMRIDKNQITPFNQLLELHGEIPICTNQSCVIGNDLREGPLKRLQFAELRRRGGTGFCESYNKVRELLKKATRESPPQFRADAQSKINLLNPEAWEIKTSEEIRDRAMKAQGVQEGMSVDNQ